MPVVEGKTEQNKVKGDNVRCVKNPCVKRMQHIKLEGDVISLPG